MLARTSDFLFQLERRALQALLVVLIGLIILNVVTRALDVAIFWVDELAIIVMVWSVFIGASYTLRLRRHIRVTLLVEALPPKSRHWCEVGIDAALCLFCLFLIWLAWIWYDPIGIASARFDAGGFASESFNFIYAEPTQTISVSKFWIWLVMPLFALTSSIHAMANLFDRVNGRIPEHVQ